MAKKKKDSGAKASDTASPKSKSSKQASSKKAKGPSIDELLVIVADTAKDAVRAGVKAQEAANKTSAKKGALKEARARAAQAKLQAARTADELAVAEAAARSAEHDEREATKALAKAKKKRADAESAASKAVDKAGKARAELESHPAAAAESKPEPQTSKKTGKPEKSEKAEKLKAEKSVVAVDAEQSAEVDALIGETLVQEAEPSDASPDSVPSELVEVETEYEPLVGNPAFEAQSDVPESVEAESGEDASIEVPTSDADGSEGIRAADLPVTDVADPAELALAAPSRSESDTPASDVPDSDWTLARLRVIARERGVRGYSAMSKARLLEVLLSEDSGAPTLGI